MAYSNNEMKPIRIYISCNELPNTKASLFHIISKLKASNLSNKKIIIIHSVDWTPYDFLTDLDIEYVNSGFAASYYEYPAIRKLWQDSNWASQLVHVGNYTDLLNTMKPDSIPRMAAFISIIRPGKAHLQRRSWSEVFAEVWDGDDSRGYTFKKSHAVSYAALVALHMNLIHTSNQGN